MGAIAAARGWALRELSWRRPTLEQIFARIATGAGDEFDRPAGEPSLAPARAPTAPVAIGGLDIAPPPAAATAAPQRAVYNLNPFDRGATRSLSVPKVVEDPNAPPSPGAGAGSSGAPRS